LNWTLKIYRNIDKNSLAIIDELGRGTSSRDGLAIALSIAEALVESKALVFFATHFRELGRPTFMLLEPWLIL
jgi:DNA mismatch repair protein MSH4